MAAAFLLPACSSLSQNSIRIGQTPASRIAKDPTITGKGVPGQCLAFANALQLKFEAAGCPVQVSRRYGYQASPVPQPGFVPAVGGEAASHAVVAHEDGGRAYIMDNQSWSPQWIQNGAPLQMAQRFSGINTDVKVARVMEDSHSELNAWDISGTTRLAAK